MAKMISRRFLCCSPLYRLGRFTIWSERKLRRWRHVWLIRESRRIREYSFLSLVKLWTRLGLTNSVKLPKAPKFEKLENAKDSFKDAIEKSREDQYIGMDHFKTEPKCWQPPLYIEIWSFLHSKYSFSQIMNPSYVEMV